MPRKSRSSSGSRSRRQSQSQSQSPSPSPSPSQSRGRSQSRSSRSKSRSRTKSRSRSRSSEPTTPKPAVSVYRSHSPVSPKAHRSKEERRSGGLATAIAIGMGLAIGSSIVRTVQSVLIPRITARPVTTVSSNAPQAAPSQSDNTIQANDSCTVQSEALQDCLNSNRNNISKCQLLMDMLSECRDKSISRNNA